MLATVVCDTWCTSIRRLVKCITMLASQIRRLHFLPIVESCILVFLVPCFSAAANAVISNGTIDMAPFWFIFLHLFHYSSIAAKRVLKPCSRSWLGTGDRAFLCSFPKDQSVDINTISIWAIHKTWAILLVASDAISAIYVLQAPFQ